MEKGQQKIYKESRSYHDLHVAELLAKGYVVVHDVPEHTIMGPAPTTTESTSKTDSPGG